MIACSSAVLAADLAGIGEHPGPGAPPQAWLVWQNDGLGASFGDKSDDLRTNSVAVGFVWREWVFGCDHSLLTQVNPTGAIPLYGEADPHVLQRVGQRRVDEVTITAGYQWRRDDWAVRGGLVVRGAGKIGGGELQELTHALIGQAEIELEYEQESLDLTPGTYVSAEFSQVMAGPLAVTLRGQGLALAEGTVDGQLGVRMSVSSTAGRWWLGADHRWHTGAVLTATQAGVVIGERGLWLTAGQGLTVGAWEFGFAWGRNVDTRIQEGAILVSGAGHPPELQTTGTWLGEVDIAWDGEGGKGQTWRGVWSPERSATGWAWGSGLAVRDWATAQTLADELSSLSLAGGPLARISWEPRATGLTPVLNCDVSCQWQRDELSGTRWVAFGDASEQVASGLVLALMPAIGLGWRGAHTSTAVQFGVELRHSFNEQEVAIVNLAAASPETRVVASTLLAGGTYPFVRWSISCQW